MSDKLIDVFECSDPSTFEGYCNAMLNEGWILKSSSIGFVNSESYDFCGSYQAIFTKCQHQMQEIYKKDNDIGSAWGTNKCMVCGYEDNWQYDYI